MWIWRVVQDPRSLPLVLIGLGGRNNFFGGKIFVEGSKFACIHIHVFLCDNGTKR